MTTAAAAADAAAARPLAAAAPAAIEKREGHILSRHPRPRPSLPSPCSHRSTDHNGSQQPIRGRSGASLLNTTYAASSCSCILTAYPQLPCSRQALFDSSPAFVAPLPPWSIPYASLILLGAAFLTSFVFTTCVCQHSPQIGGLPPAEQTVQPSDCRNEACQSQTRPLPSSQACFSALGQSQPLPGSA